MVKTIILGAGIGGLVAAHELSKDPNQNIHIYEKNSSVGGQARSSGDNFEDYSEYCWHVVGRGYIYLLPILREIPDGNGRTVADHLVPIEQFLYGRYSGRYLDERGNSFLSGQGLLGFINGVSKQGERISLRDISLLIRVFIVSLIGCVDRMDSYADIPWRTLMEDLSPEAKKWIVDSPSIYLGMKTSNLSSQLMLSIYRSRSHDFNTHSDAHFYSFDGPYHSVWLEPWVEYLKSRGVVFHLSTEVTGIEVYDDQISVVEIDGHLTQADFYVNALPVEAWAKILPEGDYKQQFNELAEHGHQIQCHVLYRLEAKLQLQAGTIIILPDTEWCVMVRVESSIWKGKYYISGGKDLLAAGIGIWDRQGINGKTAGECTREEIADEVWSQISRNSGLMAYIKLDNGESLSNITQTPEWDIWNSYMDGEAGIVTCEPKFSNSTGTLSRRPRVGDEKYKNLFHATAYTQTDMNIFCMESAAEAGKRAAGGIIHGRTDPPLKKFNDGLLVKLLRYIDKRWIYRR